MTDFVLNITKLNTTNTPLYQNVVTGVEWKLTGVDGEYSSELRGPTHLAYSESSPFIAYENLTEDTIISWITPYLNMPAMQREIQSAIDLQKQPQPKPLPWQ